MLSRLFIKVSIINEGCLEVGESFDYNLNVGKLNELEIDFVAEKQEKVKYIQVCYLLSDKETVQREFGNLEKIPDNYEKIVISMDKFFINEIKGIKHEYLLNFLINNDV